MVGVGPAAVVKDEGAIVRVSLMRQMVEAAVPTQIVRVALAAGFDPGLHRVLRDELPLGRSIHIQTGTRPHGKSVPREGLLSKHSLYYSYTDGYHD